MAKISYEERINLYYDRKNGMSFPSIKSKYGINKSGVEYLVRLIDKHGFDILRTNENKSYSSKEKQRILNRILIDNESILSVSIDEGLAVDCCYYDKNWKIIPSKIICCVAYDLGELNGIAKIDNNYVHLDNRKGSTYRRDEARGNSSYWTNPYSYFGVSKADVNKYTGESTKPSTPTNSNNGNQYQAHGINSRWYSNVSKGTDDYVGIIGQSITGVAIKGATYRVHNKTKNYWLDWVNGYNTDDKESGYAGNGSIIDAIQIN